jgi:ComF family protein
MAGMTVPSLNEMSNAAARKFDNVASRVFPAWFRFHANRTRGSDRPIRSMLGCALPQACALCADRSGNAMLCAPCMNALPPLPPTCPMCARPSPGSSVCGACLKRPPKFAATLAACAYAFPLDRLVQALKYEHRLALAEPLGDALAAAALRAPAARQQADALIAIPLTAARQRERGFNQSIEIARVVARRTGLPLLAGLVRTGNAPAQATLPWVQRRRNVSGAFACARSFAGRSIALVDDVMTTGATLESAAGTLLQSGAARVEAWVVARTPPPDGV